MEEKELSDQEHSRKCQLAELRENGWVRICQRERKREGQGGVTVVTVQMRCTTWYQNDNCRFVVAEEKLTL